MQQTGPAVTFDYAAWVAQFPAFAGLSEPQAQSFFDQAGLYCANVTSNPAFGITVYVGTTATPLLARCLYLLTAHLAWLFAPRDASGNPAQSGQPAPNIVGRISNATEGSVSVQVELKGGGSPSQEFFTQTEYGFAYWQATAQFRTFRYSPLKKPVVNGVFPSAPGRW